MLTILITTYNRPHLLMNLLRDIEAQAADTKVRVSVYDDASTEDYSEVKAFLEERQWQWHSEEENHGKIHHGRFVSKVFADQRRRKGPFLFLPDDVRLRDGFFEKMREAWESIPGSAQKRGCLRVLVSEARRNSASWTQASPKQVSDLVDDVGFFDGAALLSKAALAALDYAVPPVDASLARGPNTSSGMGKAVSFKLKAAGLGMYRVRESLVDHVAAKSQMHPSQRLEDSASAAGGENKLKYLAPVHAAVATIPGREDMLREAVGSLLPQVDKMYVYLNNFEAVPDFLVSDKIVVARSQEHGDRTDAGKFFWANKVEGYYFTFDDDIVYPANYVETLVQHIEARDRKAIVTVHGRIFPVRMPISSYYRDNRVRIFHNKHSQRTDEIVHVGGTGVMAFHTDTIKIDPDAFTAPKMADVWVGLFALKAEVPIVCIRRQAKWLRLLKNEGIFATERGADKVQTDLVNSVSWPGTERVVDPLTNNLRALEASGAASWDREAKIRNRMAAVFPEWNSRDLNRAQPALDRFLKQMMDGEAIRGAKLLDFGCGWGRLRSFLAQYGEYRGVDASEAMVALAKGRNGTVPDVSHFPVGSKLPPFATLFTFDVLTHMKKADLERLRDQIREQAKTGRVRTVFFEAERAPRALQFVEDTFPWVTEAGSLRVGGMLIKCYSGQVC